MQLGHSRRAFLRSIGAGAAVAPFISNLPSLAFANQSQRKQRLVVIFSPNGVVPETFWPDAAGRDFALKTSLEPLAALKDRTLILKGVSDRVRGDGDNHTRGIGCLLTGIELFAGNVQGGSDTPAGWASGISIDQEIKNFLRQDPATQTRFGSLEFGVLVPERADTWTRMVYAGPNKPLAPVGDAYQMFNKLYGQLQNREALGSVLDALEEDLAKVSQSVSVDDRRLLEEQTTFVRELEQELRAGSQLEIGHRAPEPDPGVDNQNDNMPAISRMQIDLMVNSFVNDFTRVATLQYTQSVGGARMKWLGIDDGHHGLSHEPDSNVEAMEKLTKFNRWFCEQVAYLAQRLADTPEPGGQGSLLDNTLIVWTNELGKGSSHTLDDIPFVLVGGAPGFAMGHSRQFDRVSHNRLLLSMAHAFGHEITTFGNPDYCGDGPLNLS
jgi:hypothetical protein